MRPSVRDRFSGCLLGQCLGDALGFLAEGAPPEDCARYVQAWLTEPGPGEEDREPPPADQYSDDSQLARELIQSYVACGGFDPRDYAGRIAAIFAEGRIVGRGRATELAARRLAEGVPWEESGTPAPSAGNGSAMRAAPIGLFFHDRPEELIHAATDQGRITHADPRCSAGAAAIAGAVALAVEGDLPTEAWPERLAEWAGKIDEGFGGHLLSLRKWLAMPPAEAVQPISRCGLEPEYRDDREGISPFVGGSVLWSLYSFLLSPYDYMETIRTSIVAGGDVDTTAAMAGAVSGAYVGIRGVPEKLRRRVTDQGTWEHDDLVDLAHRCYELKTGGAA